MTHGPREEPPDLELPLNGGFSPLAGFMTIRDHTAVCRDMRLGDGARWRMPITLDVGEPPNDAEITIDTAESTAEEAAQKIILHLEKAGYLSAEPAQA